MTDFAYAEDKGETYFELIKLAKQTNSQNEVLTGNSQSIETLNTLIDYKSSHKRLLPLLKAKALQLNIFEDLLPEVQQILNIETKVGVITELAKKSQLTNIINALAKQEIPIILLKGSAFQNIIYSSKAPRTSNDIDILVREENWDQVVTALENIMDYQEKTQPDVFGDLYEISFVPQGNIGSAVDLHKALIHPHLFTIDEQSLWDDSIESPAYNNTLVRVLSPEHSLIHQALHAYKDMDFAKYNLLDTYEIINQLKPNFYKLFDSAKKWGVNMPLYILLQNNVVLMGSRVDHVSAKQIVPSKLRRYVVSKLLLSKNRQPSNGVKSVKYRINQVLSQFFFTASIKNALSLQLAYLKSRSN